MLFAKRGDTHCVGKYVPVEGEPNKGELLFSDEFKKNYPELEHLRVFRYKGGMLSFQPIDETDGLIRRHGIERLHAGAVWALEAIVKGTPLDKALCTVFSAYGSDRRLRSLAYYLLLEADPSVDQKTGEPVYYRNVDGNVPDVSIVRNTLADLSLVGIDAANVVLVTDKGYCSTGSWENMLRNNVSFISNARRNLNTAVEQIIDENYLKLRDWNQGVGFISQNALTVPVDWCYDEFPVAGKKARKNAKRRLYFHLYYSEEVNDLMARRLKVGVCATVAQHRSNPSALTAQQTEFLEKYTDTLDDKSVQINIMKVQEQLRYAGIRVLVSDAVDNAVDCYTAYEERNAVEYSFNTLKSKLNCNRTRVHCGDAWEGRLFLEILVTAISGMVRARIKRYKEKAKSPGDSKKYRLHHDSDRQLLGLLNNIYMTTFNEGWFFDEIVGKKKELFRILSVSVPTVKHEIYQPEPAEEPGYAADIETMAIEIANDETQNL